ncbi:MAG: hypothetical protein A3D33_06180 [Candidatus Rokubacteria bacterium RIFCSPHIGHO2_02_FULL_73_26]|nr:MAG: hypothetical protein A3D33_06180 [Candidatus Rokubacteria bacterium RIFCSPHIGHO2_02_FULL_73_26]
MATTSGLCRCDTTRLHTRKTASPSTAPNTSTSPSTGAGPRAPGGPAVATLSVRTPSTASTTAAVRRAVQRSRSTSAASAAATAGVVLVTMPPSAALVSRRPKSRSTLNAKMPVSAWSTRTARSRAPSRGSRRSRATTSPSRMTDARAKRSPPIRNTGTRATSTLPTTTELPTIAIAAASSRQARRWVRSRA